MKKYHQQCNTKNIRFGMESLKALENIDRKVSLGNSLSKLVAISPLIDLFSKPKTTIQLSQDIYEYHWDEFGNAMSNVNVLVRNVVYEEANQAALFTKGKEYEFWKCIMSLTR
ncbi:hypothetical protein N9R79_12160 [Vibrio sp.]|nr:hypothetical protein [Vibrio sp.]